MFKLVVLSCLFAACLAAPGLLGYGHHVLPSAVSHQSRVDVHSAPVLTAYAAPEVYHAAPVLTAYAAPAVYAAPAAVSHQSRYDVHRSAAVLTSVHALPIAHSYGYADALHAW